LVLAERVYVDAQTNKKVICGTFNEVTLSAAFVPKPLPSPVAAEGEKGGEAKPSEGGKDDGFQTILVKSADTGSPYIYLSLTDVLDETEITLQFVNMSKNKVTLETRVKISCKDRLQTVELVVPLPPLRHIANEPGRFSFDVLWNTEILGSHRVHVKRADPEPDQQSNDKG
jgi:hypothetical protein